MIRSGYSEMRKSGLAHRSAEEISSAGMRVILHACVASMSRKKTSGKRQAAYWWTEEIAELRRTATRCRRKATRARKSGLDIILRFAEYKVAKKSLQWAINKSKKKKFKYLIQDIDADVWGKGYKIAMQRLHPRTLSVTQDVQTMTRIVDELFPTHAPREPDEEIEIGEIPKISEAEIK